MGRIRTIKPEFFKHGALFDLERETALPIRVAFAGLWTCCDREGRFKWRPRELKLDILPYDDCDFSRVLDALATRDFIKKYAVEREEFGHIPSWSEHQVINNKESASALPEPPKKKRVNPRDGNAKGTREARHLDGLKGKGKEGKGNISVEDIYLAYPKHEAKAPALRAIEKALANHDPDWLLARVQAYAETRKGQDQKYTPLPASWFNAERYDDESLQPKQQTLYVREDNTVVTK